MGGLVCFGIYFLFLILLIIWCPVDKIGDVTDIELKNKEKNGGE
jgi:hypothetical protein